MSLSRRHVLRLSASLGLLALGGCATPGLPARPGGRVVLLSPLSGPMASMGRDVEAAAALALDGRAAAPAFTAADTAGGVPVARLAGADLVLGPIFRGEVAQAVAAAGAAPVVTLSNDQSLVGGGAMVMGLTPAQSVAAILPYARRQGLRRVAVAASDDALGRAYAEAAAALAPSAGLKPAGAVLRPAGSAAGLAGELRAAGGGTMPEAVLVAGAPAALDALARPLAADGVQVLGGAEWLWRAGASDAAPLDVWFAGPDPEAFAPFAAAFERRTGRTPGLLAGLAYDAAGMAGILAAEGALNRAGLMRAAGFPGAVGAFRLRADGSTARDLAIFAERGGAAVVVDRVAAA